MSKSESLSRYSKLYNRAVESLEEGSTPAKDAILCRHDISYLAGFFEKIIRATNKLQGRKATLVQLFKTIICGSINKLEFYQQILNRKSFNFFPRLSKMSGDITDNRLLVYNELLRAVRCDMKTQFNGLLELEFFLLIALDYKMKFASCMVRGVPR